MAFHTQILKSQSLFVGAAFVTLAAMPVNAQNTAAGAADQVGQAANTATNQVGQAVNSATNQVPATLNATGQTVGQVGNTAGNLASGLQPTLQPVTQGVGNAVNNLTQPDTVSALLEFLAGVIPNHIEAHVNLDALRVEKLTVDVRGVDLRNLRVDLLVANSRNAGQVQPVMGQGSNGSQTMNNAQGTSNASNGRGGFSYGSSYPSNSTNTPANTQSGTASDTSSSSRR